MILATFLVAQVAASLGAYVQPQFRARQNDAVAQSDENGFRVRRLRVLVGAAREMDDSWGVRMKGELEGTPETEVMDAYVTGWLRLPGAGEASLSAGQFKVPISRQTLVSDADLQMVEKAGLTTLAPERQLGFGAAVRAPFAPWVEVSAGVFNGEGINLVQNADERYLYAGRVAIRPLGAEAPLAEGGFGPDTVAIGVSAGRDSRDLGTYDQRALYLGADLYGSWNGLSGTAEYLEVRTTFSTGAPRMDFKANGVNLQLGYLLPLPGWWSRRLEVVGRFEELDRNDTDPIEQRGDANQSTRTLAGGLSYYQDGHRLKLQLLAAHIIEVEDRDLSSRDATYPNDLVLAQITYRMEL